MTTKKDLVIVILATFCLTLTLFVAMPTNSSTASSSGYDPWIDINDDGWINAKDAVLLGGAFSSSGDPTKNVTIKHSYYEWATILYLKPESEYPENWWYFNLPVAGYSRVSICLSTNATRLSVMISFNIQGPLNGISNEIDNFILSSPGNSGAYKTYSVIGSRIDIRLANGNYTTEVTFAIYLTT